jgi:gliding motility-associated-like protein
VPEVTAPSAAHRWYWEPAILPETTEVFPEWSIQDTGHYQLYHIVSEGVCSDTASQVITVIIPAWVALPPYALVCGDSTYLLIPDTSQINSFRWSDGIQTLDRVANQEGDYSIIVSNDFCEDTAMTRVEVKNCYPAEVYIPNVFAPGAASPNDQFQVLYSGAIEQVEIIEIYDRWGSLIFRTATGASWDGVIGGNEAPSGVYVYQVRVRLAEGEIKRYRGDLTLIR